MIKETSSKDKWHKNIGENETEWNDFVFNFYQEEWDKLNSQEKSLCLNYNRHFDNEIKISSEMINAVTEIYKKYPDFHNGCIPTKPKKREEIRPMEFSTMDFSNFLDQEPA